jgi:hypothetical protein
MKPKILVKGDSSSVNVRKNLVLQIIGLDCHQYSVNGITHYERLSNRWYGLHW